MHVTLTSLYMLTSCDITGLIKSRIISTYSTECVARRWYVLRKGGFLEVAFIATHEITRFQVGTNNILVSRTCTGFGGQVVDLTCVFDSHNRKLLFKFFCLSQICDSGAVSVKLQLSYHCYNGRGSYTTCRHIPGNCSSYH